MNHASYDRLPPTDWTPLPRANGREQCAHAQFEPALLPRDRASEAKSACTYAAAAAATLRKLCAALGRPGHFEHCRAIESTLFEGWGERLIPEAPPYPSNIGDDCSPYEYSLGFQAGTAAELRLLVEAQAESASAVDQQAAALRLNERLSKLYRVSLERFERVRDLFIVDQPRTFSLWHAVSWKADGRAEFKVYLNPQAQGEAQSLAVVKEALRRLGLAGSQPILDAVARRGDSDEIKYLSLDLSPSASSRVKVYIAHHEATLADLEAAFALSPLHRPGDVADFCRELLGDVTSLQRRAVTSCFSFIASSHLPSAATFHLPIASYLTGDSETLRAVAGLLRRNGIDPLVYQRAFAAIARHPPSEGHATQSYASFRREHTGLRITTYLSPRLFGE